MNIDRLFNALVLGGAVLVSGCASTPEQKPTPPAASQPADDAPAAAEKKDEGAPPADAEKKDEGGSDEGGDGVCSWL